MPKPIFHLRYSAIWRYAFKFNTTTRRWRGCFFYDVEYLFANIPIKDTIEYITEQIYANKKLKPICSKVIFKSLLLKLTTDCIYTFNHKFYKQIDGCTMGGPLWVTFGDIYMIKMVSEIVIRQKPLFYRCYVDDIYSGRKRFKQDKLFEKLKNYHPKINLTIEVSSKLVTFSKQGYKLTMVSMTLEFIGKQ